MVSSLSVADQTSLRGASTNYAPFIRENYLDVPPEISQRVRDLSSDLTSQYDNPYDKALAIQNYLRNVITYNDQIEAPPNSVEPIDYFLFETREGYCNYYASSFAMMLRTQGIPTRLSRGFASGEFFEEDSLYRVRARDAHTWPEVYFSEYGWIQFEPTVIIEPVERPLGEGEAFPDPAPFSAEPNLPNDDLFEQNNLDELNDLFGGGEEPAGAAEEPSLFENPNVVRAAGASLVLAIAAGLIMMAGRMNKRVERTLDGSYGRLETWGRWLKLPLAASQTPNERVSLFRNEVPEGADSVESLVGAFVQKQFGPNKQSRFRVNPLNEWKALRPILFKRGLRNRLPFRKK